MLFGTDAREKQNVANSSFEPGKPTVARGDNDNPASGAELRQLLYKRIAEGNALAETEANAHRKWRGK